MSLPTDPPSHPAPFTRWAHDPARSIDERYLVWVLCHAVQTALEAFRTRYRKAIEELDQKLGLEDPRWYDFGLNRPADPATSGVPTGVELTALGGSSVLVEIDGAVQRRSCPPLLSLRRAGLRHRERPPKRDWRGWRKSCRMDRSPTPAPPSSRGRWITTPGN